VVVVAAEGLLVVEVVYVLEYLTKQTTNSVALVHKRTIPTERPPLVGEVGANFCRLRVSRGQLNGSPRP
jgi:hypothetical protein